MKTASALRLPAPAKLNLFLHITGRRPDGYHLLQTVFQLLDYGDWIEAEASSEASLSLTCSVPELACEDNLMLRAARLLQSHCQVTQGARLHLDKRLPLGGGLGGGSSDAASTLLALNQLWHCDLSLDELAALGLRLGADLPVFIHGRSAWAEGVGEHLQAMELPPRWFVVLTPPCHASTPEIFSHQQLTRDTSAIKMSAFPVSGTRNDCEKVACLLYPEIEEALHWLGQFAEARMTGTGASVFVSVDKREDAMRIFSQKPDKMAGFVARGVKHSPTHQALTGAGSRRDR